MGLLRWLRTRPWLYSAYRRAADALGPLPLRVRGGPLAGKTLAVRASLARSPYAGGDYEAEMARALCELARPDMVAIDIGAHFGYFTLLLAGRAARVYAFEPAPANFRALTRTLAINAVNNVEACPLAVSACDGLAVLEVTRASSICRLRGNSSSEEEEMVRALDVQTVSLDSFVRAAGVERVDLVKIDVEGEELRVLLGMQEVVRRWRPAILVEVHTCLSDGEDPRQVLHLLDRWGYTCRDVDAGGAVITDFAHTWSEHHVLAESSTQESVSCGGGDR
jgi:FkbM family methyltransferase